MLLLTPSPPDPNTSTPAAGTWRWALSGNGMTVDRHGQGPLADTPADDTVVLVLPPQALSWHAVALPKVAAVRLPSALEGLLEERLLGEPGDWQFALPPARERAVAHAEGQTWVAVCAKPWLRAQLQALEAAGRPASQVVPLMVPAAEPRWLAFGDGQTSWISASGPLGVAAWPLPEAPDAASRQTLMAALASVQAPTAADPALSSPPPPAYADAAVAGSAEAAFPDAPWSIAPPESVALEHLRQGWNLAQFDLRLSGQQRRQQALRQWVLDLWHQPRWRPMRWGLGLLALAQVAGLNAAAWQERHYLAELRQQSRAALQQAFPHVTLVLDAPRQMAQEIAALRTRQGELAPSDAEALLHQLGQTPGLPAAQRITFRPGQLTWDLANPAAVDPGQLPGTPGWRARVDRQSITWQWEGQP